MKSKGFTIAIIVLLITITSFYTIAKEYPLFESEEPLELTLEADLVTIMNDKSEEPEYTQALLIQKLPDYKINAFQIKVKPRGNTRRVTDLCDFPPLKFNFKKSQLGNTVFDGQDKLKFVSQCRQEEEFQHYVLEEYLLYKTYNLLTEESYKTRLVNITIKDIKLRVPTINMTGFLIEDDKMLAKRILAKEHEKPVHNQDSCGAQAVDRLSMFQYMIGNTDWYINTKHNTDIFERKNDKTLIPVPFDFDFAGVINTFYAIPSKEIPIQEVRQRYFKGSCRQIDSFEPTINLFNDRKDEIFALYNSFGHLPKGVIRRSLRYYSEFYKIINDKELVQKSFSSCIPEYPEFSMGN